MSLTLKSMKSCPACVPHQRSIEIPASPLPPSSLPASEAPICRICHCGEADTESIHFESKKSNDGNKCSGGGAGGCGVTLNDKGSNASIGIPIPMWDMNLIAPCCCSGSLRYVHHYCLQQWIRSSNNKSCELCKYHFKMTVKYKPFHKWEKLEMSPGERKKLLCNLLFNLISMFCVFWSIYVLIERATLEAKYGLLDWPFWTKMLVVSIGFLGGTVFLFVQLRLYFSIFLRWRQFNRIIVIHANNEKSAAIDDKMPDLVKNQRSHSSTANKFANNA